MTLRRNNKRFVSRQITMDGVGAHLVRLLGYQDVEDCDSFILLLTEKKGEDDCGVR